MCPNDGRVDVGLEDISAVVFRDQETVEVVFTCPRCAASLRATLEVPNLLAAAMQLARYAQEMGIADPDAAGRADGREGEGAEPLLDVEVRAERERAGEPYCEYFRRQLARIESVEDLLQEIDQSS